MKYTKSLMREGSPENLPQRGVERQEERPFSSLVFLVGEVGLRNRLKMYLNIKGEGQLLKQRVQPTFCIHPNPWPFDLLDGTSLDMTE